MTNNLLKDPMFLLLVSISMVAVYATVTVLSTESSTAEKIENMKLGLYNPYREFNTWINSLVFDFLKISFLPALLKEKLGEDAGYYAATYARDFVAGTLVYWLTAGSWHIMIYHIWGDELFVKKGKPFPTSAIIFDQMKLAQASLFLYAALPVFSEYLIENNFTMTYFYIDQIGGWPYYFLFLAIYYTCIEFGIYWIHRTLHTNKFLYKYIHGLHHKYNKECEMSPWCSIAFNPIDGIMQASPYVICLFFVPVHYFTHMVAVFLTGVWATYIHDAALGNVEPIMGSMYHTIHHTHYHYNFGQIFTFWDRYYGTLRSRDDLNDLKKKKNSKDNLKEK